MTATQRCPFCGGCRTRPAVWAYLAAGTAKLTTKPLDVRCKWCKGTGVRAVGNRPKGAS